MEVNYIQVSYTLGVTPLNAKIMMHPFVERLKEKSGGGQKIC